MTNSLSGALNHEISFGHVVFCSKHPSEPSLEKMKCILPHYSPTGSYALLSALPQGGYFLLVGLSARHLAVSGCPFTTDVRSGHRIRFERIRKQNYKALFYVEYKARERIHRSVADLRLLAIPAS